MYPVLIFVGLEKPLPSALLSSRYSIDLLASPIIDSEPVEHFQALSILDLLDKLIHTLLYVEKGLTGATVRL